MLEWISGSGASAYVKEFERGKEGDHLLFKKNRRWFFGFLVRILHVPINILASV